MIVHHETENGKSAPQDQQFAHPLEGSGLTLRCHADFLSWNGVEIPPERAAEFIENPLEVLLDLVGCTLDDLANYREFHASGQRCTGTKSRGGRCTHLVQQVPSSEAGLDRFVFGIDDRCSYHKEGGQS